MLNYAKAIRGFRPPPPITHYAGNADLSQVKRKTPAGFATALKSRVTFSAGEL